MPTVISKTLVVDNVNEVVKSYDKIVVERSIAGSGGPFTEYTTPTTRIAIVPNQANYLWTDPVGETSYYYRIYYLNSETGDATDPGEAFPGEEDPALSVISVQQLLDNYLFGIDLTDDNGTPIPNSTYVWYIKAAVAWLESRLDIAIVPTTIVDETQDWYKEDWYRDITIFLNRFPVQSVSRLELQLYPESTTIDFDTDWIRFRSPNGIDGVLNVVPGSSAVSSVLFGVGSWPLVATANKSFPLVFHIDYVAGFPEGQVPYDLRHAVGMIASFGPFNIAGDLLGGAGIASQSISLDGLSQSFNTTSSATNAGYGARLVQYNKELKAMLPQLYRAYHPVNMTVV